MTQPAMVPAAQPTTVAVESLQTPQAPVEFTACVSPGPEVQPGTEEDSQVSLPDGEMTITRTRGYTWQSTVSDVSDPRLVGTWYNSVDGDHYTNPGGGASPTFDAWTHRIENDEGAWQGSLVGIDFPDGERSDGPLVLIGEGAYEGLTAVTIVRIGGAPARTPGATSSKAAFRRLPCRKPASSRRHVAGRDRPHVALRMPVMVGVRLASRSRAQIIRSVD